MGKVLIHTMGLAATAYDVVTGEVLHRQEGLGHYADGQTAIALSGGGDVVMTGDFGLAKADPPELA